jgi:nucleoporin NUP159
MIDRIGLNSRALQSFIKGHSTLYKESGRTKEDLDNPEDWVLVEAEDLGVLVEGDLTRELEEGRVKDVEETQEAIRAIMRDLPKLRAKQNDMHKIIMANVDPEQASISRSLPLNAEQATQQNELRKSYANITKLLSEAEESLTMLRAKIAATGGATRKTGAPTVEAVIRTIKKMTTMAEKRSVDIDVLETQMRKIRVGTPGVGSPGPRSREGSPFVGGTPHRRSLLMSQTTMRDSFASSAASYGGRGTPPRRKMSMYTEEERMAVQSKQAKRKAKLGMLRESLERAGPQVSTLQDYD